jgi:hypothetical protein
MYSNNAQELLNYLLGLQSQGINLENVSLNFRIDEDSDVEQINFVGEDLYDAETNSILQGIMFYTEIENNSD